ncbi:MAG: glycosyltransferase [Planctomycetaceae bacterium]
MPSESIARGATRPTHQTGSRKVVLTTFGSLGDIHPFIAVALGLRERGHEAVIATSSFYREKIEALGIGFAPVRPDLPDPLHNVELMRKVLDLRTGSRFVVRDFVMPVVRDSYADTLAAARGADLLVSHPLTYTTPLVAEQLKIPWASSMLAPLGFFSKHDPPVLPPAQWAKHLRFAGPTLWGPLFGLARYGIKHWARPYYQLRAELGLPPARQSPLFEGQHSPHLVLAMFSRVLGEQQPDWPAATRITGFALYDRHDEYHALPAELARFLDEGDPPIVFTLGSSAVMDAGPFYEYAAQAAVRLKRRAVLLIGLDERNRLSTLPAGVIACEYAPYSELFPRAAAIVHQGGAGTMAQALRAGRPMLVMPYANDQPDNADRCVRIGVARTIARQGVTPGRLERELRRLLDDGGYTRRATEIGRQVCAEDGVAAACNALEQVIRGRTSGAIHAAI